MNLFRTAGKPAAKAHQGEYTEASSQALVPQAHGNSILKKNAQAPGRAQSELKHVSLPSG